MTYDPYSFHRHPGHAALHCMTSAVRPSSLEEHMLYPLAAEELFREPLPHGKKLFVLYTGHKDCPKKGQWYLSGSIIEGYCAKHDLPTQYPIGELVTGDQPCTNYRVSFLTKGKP